MAPRAGFEPATNRLTAGCSTTELPGNRGSHVSGAAYSKPFSALQRSISHFSEAFSLRRFSQSFADALILAVLLGIWNRKRGCGLDSTVLLNGQKG